MKLLLSIWTVILILRTEVYGSDDASNNVVRKLCNDAEVAYKIEAGHDDGEVPTTSQTDAKCVCQTKGTQPWGLAYLLIECREMNWTNDLFQAQILPFGTEYLDVSWNKFNYVPKFNGNRLKTLILSYNNITTIEDEMFEKTPNLLQLDLSSNRIEKISLDAFNHLSSLQKLDLSRNNIINIQPNVLSPMTSLTNLIISENNLNETLFQYDLYLVLGAATNLGSLELNYCGLERINLKYGTGLKSLSLRFNNFTQMPHIPNAVEYIDFSGNPLAELQPKFLPHLYKLHTLLFEDMPKLSEIKEYALFGFPRLTTLNFQGSKNLSRFDEHAFGATVVLNETDTVLETLNMRGCKLQTLNSTLRFALENAKTIDLSGNPFFCDCRLGWIKGLPLETKAQCIRPIFLRGKKLSDIDESQMQCKKPWVSNLLNGLLVLLLLVLCSIAIYLIVMGVRPSRRMHLQKLGASSPYARITTSTITIEPNRAENNL